jgi:hypothetical protein
MIAQGKAAEQPQPWVTDPNKPSFFVTRPRERRMTKKAYVCFLQSSEEAVRRVLLKFPVPARIKFLSAPFTDRR